MSDGEDTSYVGYTDEIHAKLDSIEHALVELGEELLLNERTEAEYAVRGDRFGRLYGAL